MVRTNPTETIDISLSAYINKKKAATLSHMVGGIPDYAYGVDYMLRQKIKAIPGFYQLAKALTNTYVPHRKQQLNLSCLKVGPSQLPEIYKYVVDCARVLGIGIPTVFIEPSPSTINAYAMAVEDDSPLIVLTSALVERLTPGEIKTVIGHECGHIHNNHGIYNTAAEIILTSLQIAIPGVQQILQLVSAPLRWAFMSWSRAGEITCDRAGVICGDDINDAISVQAKFMYGAALNNTTVNIDAALKQYETLKSTPVRLLEMESTHPLSIKRIFAIKEFANSEVLYTWRPEWKTPALDLINKQELDARCEKYVSVIKG